MTFDEVLTKVRELLEREGRVAYRTLKLRFNIDEAVIAGLKDELIHAKRVAVDEEDKVLVWVGDPAQRSSQQPATTAKPTPRKAKPTRQASPKVQKPQRATAGLVQLNSIRPKPNAGS